MHQLRVAIVPAYLLLCLLLGGASAAGIWANMLLQLLAIPLLAASLLAEPSTPVSSAGRQLIALALLAVAVILAQLIPLPPAVWTALPGREPVAAGFAALDQPLPWLPLSLSPHRTISSALWLLPAFAILLAILRLRAFKPNLIAWVVIGVTAASVAISPLQITGGEGSPWYFYSITNFGVSTGFFANANHFATLLFCTFPFLTALYLRARAKGRSMQRASGLLVILVGAVIVVFVGLAVNRSIAGIGLAVPVLAGCVVMIASRKRRVPRWVGGIVALCVLASVGAAFSAPFGNNLTTDAARTSQGSRYESFSLGLAAAADYAPVGSGIGTFQEIYPTYEDPATVITTFMNHVHGDYIELALETGAVGLLALLLFLIWWTRRAIAIWIAEDRDYFALAATIASAGILAHSLVDYPLRTAALSALFAVCCALMAEVRPAGRARRAEDDSSAPEARHLSVD
jgi:O-antigen ligase